MCRYVSLESKNQGLQNLFRERSGAPVSVSGRVLFPTLQRSTSSYSSLLCHSILKADVRSYKDVVLVVIPCSVLGRGSDGVGSDGCQDLTERYAVMGTEDTRSVF